jgi:hypothetical protein
MRGFGVFEKNKRRRIKNNSEAILKYPREILPRIFIDSGFRSVDDLLHHVLVDSLAGSSGTIRRKFFPDFGCTERRPGRKGRVVALTTEPESCFYSGFSCILVFFFLLKQPSLTRNKFEVHELIIETPLLH